MHGTQNGFTTPNRINGSLSSARSLSAYSNKWAVISASSLVVTSFCFLLDEIAEFDLWAVILLCLASYAVIEWRKLPKQCYFLALVTLITAILLYQKGGFTEESLKEGINRSAFYVLFITSFVIMGGVARSSPQIKQCSEVILEQPPSRRYAVLTFASHLLSPLLSIGTGNLMGTIVKLSTAQSVAGLDPLITVIRRRRMTTAVMRGMCSITLWSPTTLIVGVLLTTTPNLLWIDIAIPGATAAFTLMSAGWILDWLTRPKNLSPDLSVRNGDMRRLMSFLPLLGLVLIILIGSTVLESWFGVRQIIALLLCVITCSLVWLMIQGGSFINALPHLNNRLRAEFVLTLTNSRGEVVIVTLAGLLGVFVSLQLSDSFLAGIVNSLGFDEAGTLIAISVLVLITANLGITPLITIALAAESIWLIPDMQFNNQAVVFCFTGTWIIYTMTSPLSLQVRMLATAVDEDAFHIGIRWNGLFGLSTLMTLYLCIYLLS